MSLSQFLGITTPEQLLIVVVVSQLLTPIVGLLGLWASDWWIGRRHRRKP
jgi:hypothetical protein